MALDLEPGSAYVLAHRACDRVAWVGDHAEIHRRAVALGFVPSDEWEVRPLRSSDTIAIRKGPCCGSTPAGDAS